MAKRRTLRATDLRALAAFARAYLHEDVLVEYGTAEDAAAAFARDADQLERRQLAEDLDRVTVLAGHWSPERLARFFTQALGAAWAPASLDEVRTLAARVSRDAE